MKAIEEYAALAGRYDRRYRYYNARSHREILRQLGVLDDACVVDAGCGTGLLLERIARRAPNTKRVGIDPSPEMLAVARQRLPADTRLLQAGSEALPLGTQSVDLLVSSSSLHCLPDAGPAIAEFSRVLRPGGRLILADWCADALSVRLMECSLRLLGRSPTYALRTEKLLELFALNRLTLSELRRFSAGYPWDMYLACARQSG